MLKYVSMRRFFYTTKTYVSKIQLFKCTQKQLKDVEMSRIISVKFNITTLIFHIVFGRHMSVAMYSMLKTSHATVVARKHLVVKGIYLSKALTCMKTFLYKQELLLCQGDGYIWPHCCMNNLCIPYRSLYAPTYNF